MSELNRKQRRASLQKERPFSNKKGVQLIVTKIGNEFIKYKKVLQQFKGKTIVHYVES